MYENELRLFQRSKDVIWTDEYISKSLLDAHIDESHDAASRNLSKRLNIVNWIDTNIEPHSKIIDLGCGPGLYSFELGKLGHHVLGVDFNRESVNYALKNNCINENTEYRYCNYLQDAIGGKYNIAMMIYCDFGALIPDEQRILLDKIHDLLEDDGIFVFDVFGKSELSNIKEKKDWFISEGSDFWSKDPYIFTEEVKIYEKDNAVGRRYYVINQLNGKISEYIIWDQYYDEYSIGKLLDENGFKIITIKNDLIKAKEETFFIMAKK